MSAVVLRLDDHRFVPSDAWSPVRLYRSGQVVWWRGRPWESLRDGNAARPEAVVEGHLYVSESWAPVWDEAGANEI